jgi:hypothetical protein
MCKGGECRGEKRKCVAFDICHDQGECNDPKGGRCTNPDKPVCELPEDEDTEDGGQKPVVPEGVVYCGDNDDCKDQQEKKTCAEGVCCTSDCKMKCHSCVVPDKIGECTQAADGTDPRNDCSASNECDKTCSNGDCVDASEGTVCSPMECFEDEIHGARAARCSGKGAACSSADRIPFNCSPYRCIKALGACSSSCSKIEDCAVPYVCSPEGECVSAPPISSGYASSCSLAAAAAAAPAPTSKPEGSRAAWIAMLVAGLLAARRKQKLSANPQA